jgi:hypothetical protein
MKKIMVLSAMLATILMSSCTSSTPYGECVGLLEQPRPELVYEVDTGNIVLAVIFGETIIVPVIVALEEYKCPVDKLN